MQRPRNEAAFAEMVEAFNTGAFYQCHEIIEDDLWYPLPPGPEKELYQGILQVAVGLHHWQQGNARGAVSLLKKGIARLTPYQHTLPYARWIDLVRLVAETEHLIDVGLKNGVGYLPQPLPRLWLSAV